MSTERLHDGDTFTHRGHEFKINIHRDDWHGAPWKECDGHGTVSEWTRRVKTPGERILVKDRHGARRYYDVAGTIQTARRDQWGCDHPEHTTAGQRAACAVDQDFEHLRTWCADLWEYVDLDVSLVEDFRHHETISGVEYGLDRFYPYVSELARELADQILTVIEVEHPNVLLSEN